MKKLLMMTAVAAMACGAWASETVQTYAFGFTITGIPYSYSQLTGGATMYLIDTANNNILAYSTAAEMDSGNRQLATPGVKMISADIEHKAEQSQSVTIMGQTYFYKSHYLQAGSTVQDIYYDSNGDTMVINNDGKPTKGGQVVDASTKDVEFKLKLASYDDAVQQSIANALSAGSNNKLAAILYDQEGGYYQYFSNIGVLGTSNSPDFQANGPYDSVPEPTSGLLVLLGMAGLALRRRRAA